MTRRKYVDVTVSWAYGDCCPTAKVPLADWAKVLRGDDVWAFGRYMYEGQRFDACFAFNDRGLGTLTVSYDGGGDGFIGRIDEAEIIGAELPEGWG